MLYGRLIFDLGKLTWEILVCFFLFKSMQYWLMMFIAMKVLINQTSHCLYLVPNIHVTLEV